MSKNDLRFLDPGDLPTRRAWDEAVKAAPNATVFHTTAWMDVLRQGLGLEPRFAYLRGPHGTVRALIPLFHAGGWLRPVRWLNLPQSCASDPLAEAPDDAIALVEQLAAFANAHDVEALVLRTPQDLGLTLPEGWEISRNRSLVRHAISLEGASEIRTLPGLQRRQRETFQSTLRKLESNGLRPRLARQADAHLFARAVHRILLRRHGHLGMPLAFFKALLQHVPDNTRLAMIGRPNEPVLACTVTLCYRDRCDFLYGSGLPSTQGSDAYRVCLGSEIDAAIRGGKMTFDMHETGPENHGLIASKERWGASRVDGSYLIIARKGTDCGLRAAGQGFALARRILRHAPVSVSLALSGPVHQALQ